MNHKALDDSLRAVTYQRRQSAGWIADRTAHYVAQRFHVRDLEGLREALALAVEAVERYQLCYHADMMRVEPEELEYAIRLHPENYRITRAELLAELCLHGARHGYLQPSDTQCFFCEHRNRLLQIAVQAAQ